MFYSVQFAGFPITEFNAPPMGLKDYVNYAWSIAHGGQVPDAEMIGRDKMIQMRPDLANDPQFAEMSWSEILDSKEYQDLH